MPPLQINLEETQLAAGLVSKMLDLITEKFQISREYVSACADAEGEVARKQGFALLWHWCPRPNSTREDPVHQLMMVGFEPGSDAPRVEGVLAQALQQQGGAAVSVRGLAGTADYGVSIGEEEEIYFDGKEVGLNLRWERNASNGIWAIKVLGRAQLDAKQHAAAGRDRGASARPLASEPMVSAQPLPSGSELPAATEVVPQLPPPPPPPLRLVDISVSEGPSGGGTMVWVEGEGFGASTVVLFGGRQAQVVAVTSAMLLKCRSPPCEMAGASAKRVPVIVADASGLAPQAEAEAEAEAVVFAYQATKAVLAPDGSFEVRRLHGIITVLGHHQGADLHIVRSHLQGSGREDGNFRNPRKAGQLDVVSGVLHTMLGADVRTVGDVTRVVRPGHAMHDVIIRCPPTQFGGKPPQEIPDAIREAADGWLVSRILSYQCRTLANGRIDAEYIAVVHP